MATRKPILEETLGSSGPTASADAMASGLLDRHDERQPVVF
jgi:hypothetical protein